MPSTQYHGMEDEVPEISDTESIIELRRQVSAIDLASQSNVATTADLREVYGLSVTLYSYSDGGFRPSSKLSCLILH